MTTSDEAMDNALRRAISHRTVPAEHPSPEELRKYHLKLLGEENKESLRDHLALCPECAETYLELGRFPYDEPLDAPAELPTEAEAEEAWQRLRAQLPRRRWSWRDSATELPWGRLAAALVGLGLFFALGLTFARQGRQALQPTARIVLWDLEPETELYRGVPAPGSEDLEETIPVGAETQRIVLVLNLAEPPGHEEFWVEILDSEDAQVWRGDATGPGTFGSFAVELPRSFLGTGRYTLHLYGSTAGSQERIATYRIRLGPP